MKAAIYSGSFDPVTNGHLDIIKRAASMYDKLHVVVGSNPAKKYLLSLWVRVNLIRQLTKDLPNVVVVGLGNKLLVDYAYENNLKFIIKGVRNNQDFDYERNMHEVNVTQQRGIETQILISRPELSHISSSAVKELSKHHGIVHQYAPMIVKETLEFAHNQIIIGLTGTIASGKSTLMKDIKMNFFSNVFHVDLDVLAHELLMTDTTPLAQSLRDEVRARFKLKYFMPQDPIDRKELGDKVFGKPEELGALNAMYREPLLYKVRQAMQKAGDARYIVLDGALLAEAGLLFLCNNNVLITNAKSEEIYKRLHARGLTPEQCERRVKSQYSYEQKLKIINDRIAKDDCGYVSSINTNDKYKYTQSIFNHWQVMFGSFQSKNLCSNPDSVFTY
jgi:pantetheine-phosphate adenylyltransferase